MSQPMTALPGQLTDWPLQLQADGHELGMAFDAAESTRVPTLLRRLNELGIGFKDIHTGQSSLEDIFVSLVSKRA